MTTATFGKPTAPILVITDAPDDQCWSARTPFTRNMGTLFFRKAKAEGFSEEDFYFIAGSPPILEQDLKSEKRKNDHILAYRETLMAAIAGCNPRVVVTLGAAGLVAVLGKGAPIMKNRGILRETEFSFGKRTHLPMLSPGHVLKRPDVADLFEVDFRTLGQVFDAGGVIPDHITDVSAKYEWLTDLSRILKDRPKVISLDTETTGVQWYNRSKVRPLTVQFAIAPGESFAVPLCREYWPMSQRALAGIKGQVRELLADPGVKKVGHNLSFDMHILREAALPVDGYYVDTQNLAFLVDENMQSKALDECVRRWVPEMAGYSDVFDKDPVHLGKTRMDLVPHDKMLMYGAGDTDATFRLAKTLLPKAMEDAQNWACYKFIQRPVLKVFHSVSEVAGMRMDTNELHRLMVELDGMEKAQYEELIAMVPAKVKLANMRGDGHKPGNNGRDSGLKFSTPAFLQACLFGPDFLKLKPRVFTPGTEALPNPADRIPSTSTKMHLPYFVHHPFVEKLIAYQKLQKVQTTYVGEPAHTTHVERGRKGAKFMMPIEHPATGFWQHLHEDLIHPAFLLHRTNTGRTASASPNAQNFPKRGSIAKAFRRCFIPTPGHRFFECDLSQAEIRIAAWMANAQSMIRIYAADGDIHAATAAAVAGIPLFKFEAGRKDSTILADVIDEWPGSAKYLSELSPADRLTFTVKKFCDILRYRAKAVNFGFLYGMGWRKFMGYAKTDYGIDFTEEEAKEIRTNFFKAYPELPAWHERMRKEANDNFFVRALHGSLRRLPNINSNEEGIRAETGRQAINAPVQRFASDLGLIGLIRIARDIPTETLRPIAFIHDALILEYPDEPGLKEELAPTIKFYMQTAPLEAWFGIVPPLPLIADVSEGPILSEVEEMKGVIARAPIGYDPQRDYDMAA